MSETTPAMQAFYRTALELHASAYEHAADEIETDDSPPDAAEVKAERVALFRRMSELRFEVQKEDDASRVVRPLFIDPAPKPEPVFAGVTTRAHADAYVQIRDILGMVYEDGTPYEPSEVVEAVRMLRDAEPNAQIELSELKGLGHPIDEDVFTLVDLGVAVMHLEGASALIVQAIKDAERLVELEGECELRAAREKMLEHRLAVAKKEVMHWQAEAGKTADEVTDRVMRDRSPLFIEVRDASGLLGQAIDERDLLKRDLLAIARATGIVESADGHNEEPGPTRAIVESIVVNRANLDAANEIIGALDEIVGDEFETMTPELIDRAQAMRKGLEVTRTERTMLQAIVHKVSDALQADDPSQGYPATPSVPDAVRERLKLLEHLREKVANAMTHVPPMLCEDDDPRGVLGALCCPLNEPGHFWKDGCPARCEDAEKVKIERSNAVAAMLDDARALVHSIHAGEAMTGRPDYTEVDATWLEELDASIADDRPYTKPFYFYTRDLKELIRLARVGIAAEEGK